MQNLRNISIMTASTSAAHAAEMAGTAAPSETREDINNRAMVAPAPRLASGLTLRSISLGSLEILRQLGNTMANPAMETQEADTRTIAEFIWVHAAPLEEVLEATYNKPALVPRIVAEFSMRVSPAELKDIVTAIMRDRAALASVSATPLPDDDLPESKNALAPRP